MSCLVWLRGRRIRGSRAVRSIYCVVGVGGYRIICGMDGGYVVVGHWVFIWGFLFDFLMSEVEVPDELYDALLEEALEKGMSIEEYISKLVEACSKREK